MTSLPDMPGRSGKEREGGRAFRYLTPAQAATVGRCRRAYGGSSSGRVFRLRELAHQGEGARCCSYGGHIQAVNPAQVKRITANRIQENENPYVTYCSNCRDVFASAGKKCSHILDVLFDTGVPERPAPDLSRRRRNRIELVNILTGKVNAEKGNYDHMEPITLDISPELQKQMNDHLILDEDVISVIRHCEATGKLVQNKSNGELTGHLCQGNRNILGYI